MRKNWSLLLALLSIIVIAVACSNEEVTETDSNNETDEATNAPAEPVSESEEPEESSFKNVYPFTGEPTNDGVNNRAVAVMVNNHPEARPQSGLSKADVVFEILSEYNITRLMAIFQSEQPEIVGPVRSARPYYFHLADDYEAIYVYHGAAGFINDMITGGAVDHLNGAIYDNDKHLFKREDFRVAPHNSYLLFDAVYEMAENKGYEVHVDHREFPFLKEEAIETIDGEDAIEVSFHYTSTPVRYTYDATTEKYSRFNGQMRTVELNSEEPIQLDNVLIMETYHEIVDDSGRREIDFESGGDAYLLQKGKVQQVEWKNVDGQILPYKDGAQVGLVPGKTWINVIPSSTGLESVTFQK